MPSTSTTKIPMPSFRRYYDKPNYDEEVERRRPDTENLDVLDTPL